MNVSSDDLRLISEIYDVVLDPGAWGRVLDSFVARSGAVACSLMVADATCPDTEFSGRSERYRDPGLLRDYYARFAAYERAGLEVMRNARPRAWIPDGEAFKLPATAIESSIWLRDRIGAFRRVSAPLNDTEAWFDMASLAYDRSEPTVAPGVLAAGVDLPPSSREGCRNDPSVRIPAVAVPSDSGCSGPCSSGRPLSLGERGSSH